MKFRNVNETLRNNLPHLEKSMLIFTVVLKFIFKYRQFENKIVKHFKNTKTPKNYKALKYTVLNDTILKTFREFERVIERKQKNSQRLLDHESIKHQEIWLYCMLFPTNKSNL